MKNRLLSLFLTLFCLLPTFTQGEAAPPLEQIATAPISVRVLLTALNVTNRLDVTLTADYIGESKNQPLFLRKGSQWTFVVQENSLYLYSDSINLRLHDSLVLRRAGTVGGWVRTGFGGEYSGDLHLLLKNGQLLPILEIELETYLQGVLPYEMSDSFPLEALKAQAIAARTYAIQSLRPNKDYDVTDNPSSQVFKADTADYPHCRQAIAETRGVCGYYKNQPAKCYYSASNGGQTELVTSVWETQEDFSYYQSVHDPYDVENPESPVRSFTLQKHYSTAAPEALRSLFAEQLRPWLVQQGCEPNAQALQIHDILSCTLAQPNPKSPAVHALLQISASISIRKAQQQSGGITITVLNDSYTKIEEPVSLQIPVFPDAEAAFGMDINRGSDNEIWSVTETETAYTLKALRYGHGVGMSQRGAEWMAKAYQKTYRDILHFYYPGLTLKRFVYLAQTPSPYENLLQSTPGPAATPTPRPTAVPLLSTPAPGEQIAIVSEIDDDSSLNLRAEPALSAEIITRLYKHQRLILEEYCEDGWVKVRTDTLNGYVKLEFLTIADTSAQP